MNYKYILIFFIQGICLFLQNSFAQCSLSGKVYDENQKILKGTDVSILIVEKDIEVRAKKGAYQVDLPEGQYTIAIFARSHSAYESIHIKGDTVVDFTLSFLEVDLDEARVDGDLEKRHLSDVHNMGIYSCKKTEYIDLKESVANLAANQSRQIYSKIGGLNVWENDNSGLQLNIGGRGLSPNRTSNFNTRQNGYDISADALGYPESYYTPPAQALSGIEVIRGAASLQYGTQFGGMLNFRMKKGDEQKPFVFDTEQTYGAFNFFNSFNSIGGTVAKGKLNYYGFYQYKRGDGWRENTDFYNHSAYLSIDYRPNEKLSINPEFTYFQYLAHQGGGLTDREFEQKPRNSKRERNWFRVDWNIGALNVRYNFNAKTSIDFRNFVLLAQRQSLGNLEAINRIDYGGDRNLIKGRYLNIGNESRFLHRYNLLNRISSFLCGFRIYKGNTTQQQGFGNNGRTGLRSDFDFSTEQQGNLSSDYLFPSFNFAAFAENVFSISEHFNVTPGFRYEYIQTAADGYYQNLVVFDSPTGKDTLINEQIQEQRSNARSIFLAGIGVSYKPLKEDAENRIEVYANFSQNYRGITFNDMRITNPNQEIDPNLRDEFGFNSDLGIRGKLDDLFVFDISAFYLSYKRRIGSLSQVRSNPDNPALLETYNLRTNIGDARVIGIESLLELNVWKLFKADSDFDCTAFVNYSYLNGLYLNNALPAARGKMLEHVAPMIIRTGVNFRYKELKLAMQYSYTAKHYSDATNAEYVANATIGAIPSYGVLDCSANYTWKDLRIAAGVNNLTNEAYFSRRATSYPGPGILPGEGLSWYVSVKYRLGLPLAQKK